MRQWLLNESDAGIGARGKVGGEIVFGPAFIGVDNEFCLRGGATHGGNAFGVIVRAEQIFAAYRQILPPRTSPVKPLRLILLCSLHEYQAVLTKLGVTARFQNPACFIEDKNTVVIGSDLTRLSAAMGLL